MIGLTRLQQMHQIEVAGGGGEGKVLVYVSEKKIGEKFLLEPMILASIQGRN